MEVASDVVGWVILFGLMRFWYGSYIIWKDRLSFCREHGNTYRTVRKRYVYEDGEDAQQEDVR